MILLALFDGVSIPQNADILFQALFKIASFELVPTDMIYEEVFNSDPEGGIPVSPIFENIGLEHHLLMNNFGTLGFFFALYPFFYLTYFVVVQF